MLPVKDFSFTKLWRKLTSAGIRSTLHSSVELVLRKLILTPLFQYLLDRKFVQYVSSDELTESAYQTYTFEDTDDNAETGSDTTRRLTALSNAYLLTTTGAGLQRDGKIIGETVGPQAKQTKKIAVSFVRHLYFDGPIFLLRLLAPGIVAPKNESSKIDTAAAMIPIYTNYYHWTIECLPKLRTIDEYTSLTGDEVTILLPSDVPGWMAESLRLLDLDRISTQKANASVYRASKLLVPSFPSPTKKDCEWIRRRVLSNSSGFPETMAKSERVYISRSNARERRVVNESAVIATLSRLDFEVYTLEELSVAQQASLFNDATIVVGAHGAGLSNIIYCEECSVIELFGSKIKSNYEKLARANDLQYKSIECEPKGVDLVVDTRTLVDAIESCTE